MASATIFTTEFVSISIFDEKTYFFSFKKGEIYDKVFDTLLLEKFITSTEETDAHINHTLTLNSVQTTNQYIARKRGVLGYDDCINITKTFGEQLQDLEQKKVMLVSFNLKDLVVLNDDTYIYLNFSSLLPINDDNTITVNIPLMPSLFFSPELDKITEIPTSIHKNTWIYSFASIVSFCLTGNSESYLNKIYKEKPMLLEMIIGLPLYYLLLRCFNDVSQKRVFLYI